MMRRSSTAEAAQVVERLRSRDTKRVDAARARLSILGVEAVDVLVEALEGGNDTVRARVMPVLALIGDPAGREPLIAMLLDRSARLRAIAARSLGRFPSADAVAALNRVLQRDRSLLVQIESVHALVEQFAGGQECAIRLVLECLMDTEREPRLRVAAMALLPALTPARRRAVLARLAEDPCREVRGRASEIAATQDDQPAEAEVDALLSRLGAADYAVWHESVHQLAAYGSQVVDPIVRRMRRRERDPEYCARAGMALKAMGPRRARAIGDTLDATDEPIPLGVLVEVVGAIGQRPTIYRLRGLIDRIAERAVPGTTRFDPMDRVRARAHIELARIGSRVAIDDLTDRLADRDRPLDIEYLMAVEMIGKREEIGVLLLAWDRADDEGRERIGPVVLTIMRRERMRRNSRFFRALSARQRKALDSILPPIRRRPRGPVSSGSRAG